MNQDIVNQLNSSNLSNNDIQNLLKALGQTSLGKKGTKLNPLDKNNLLNKLNNESSEYNVEKEDPTKNMTEEEKKQFHREELRRKLREKQGKFKDARCSKVLMQKKYTDQLSKIQNMNIPETNPETNNPETDQIVVDPKKKEKKETSDEETLDDFLN